MPVPQPEQGAMLQQMLACLKVLIRTEIMRDKPAMPAWATDWDVLTHG